MDPGILCFNCTCLFRFNFVYS
uniref:Uncharacterized protein n=1 Tax=Arundo donax TaxID=35708 RepID=A0A0A9FNU2_ARUDO